MERYTLIDSRKSSNYCSTIIIVVVVSAFLVGTWITMSSLADSSETFSLSVELTKDVKPYTVNKRNSRAFEDNSGDLLEDGLKRNVNLANGRDESDSKPQENENRHQNFGKLGDLSKKEKLEKDSSDDDKRIASIERKS